MVERTYIYCPSCGAEMYYDDELKLVCPICDIQYSYTNTSDSGGTIKWLT